MATKLILLKSGEDIVSEISEYFVGEKFLGYNLTKPCVVKLIEQFNESADSNYKINMVPWMVLSKDTTIPIPFDWVVTVTEPIDEVKDMYEKEVINNGRDAN